MREEAGTMRPGHGPRPSQILGELLASREAAARQEQAADCRALAVDSTIKANRELAAVETARLGYEWLLHRLDPWQRRPVQVVEGVSLLAVLVAGVNVINTIELGPALAGVRLVLATFAANIAWLTLAWSAALAGRDQRWSTVASAVSGASVLAFTLAAVHGTDPTRGWPTALGEDYRSTVSGILLGLLLLALGAAAAVLIAHTEPVSCFVARRRWHRARASYQIAVKRKRADSEAASAAAAEWLDLVRSYASEATGGDQDIVEATVALASALLTNGRPSFPPAMLLPPRSGQGRGSQRARTDDRPSRQARPRFSPCAGPQRPPRAPGHDAPGRARAG
jgi:hypothetical protein